MGVRTTVRSFHARRGWGPKYGLYRRATDNAAVWPPWDVIDHVTEFMVIMAVRSKGGPADSWTGWYHHLYFLYSPASQHPIQKQAPSSGMVTSWPRSKNIVANVASVAVTFQAISSCHFSSFPCLFPIHRSFRLFCRPPRTSPMRCTRPWRGPCLLPPVQETRPSMGGMVLSC